MITNKKTLTQVLEVLRARGVEFGTCTRIRSEKKVQLTRTDALTLALGCACGPVTRKGAMLLLSQIVELNTEDFGGYVRIAGQTVKCSHKRRILDAISWMFNSFYGCSSGTTWSWNQFYTKSRCSVPRRNRNFYRVARNRWTLNQSGEQRYNTLCRTLFEENYNV